MDSINEYLIKEHIHNGHHTTISSGSKKTDETPLIIKILNIDFPSPKEIAQFKKEFSTTTSIDSKWVIKAVSYEIFRNRNFIVFEDFGGTSLDKLDLTILSLEEKLALCIQIAKALEDIHHHSIIHKDINPSNIVWNKNTNEVKLIDFGISTSLRKETQTNKTIGKLEGTLPYLSPEQTGRTNRSLDNRTDIYSFGITMYEIFTGRLPFSAQDPVELVHSHLAVLPQKPSETNESVPEVLSDIIFKCISKSADDRYQSARGIKSDLENCLSQLKRNENGEILPFEIAMQDFSDKFNISQKLYGRRNQLNELFEIVENQVSNFRNLVMVSGYSGMGKSTFVNEIQKSGILSKASFVSGKFNEFERNLSYAPLIEAFREMTRQILAGSDPEIDIWKKRFLNNLGPNGQIIIDVIPEFELIIGKQSPLPDLAPTETQNRFNHYFLEFIKSFSDPDHQLIIFIDDLQWADLEFLKLFELIVTDSEIHNILFIGAYRENEINETHYLRTSLKEIQNKGVKVTTIQLHPLDQEDILNLIDDTLKSDKIQSRPLADLCHQKTQGNPFFLNQFLTSLYDTKNINFDPNELVWKWDLEKINLLPMTDNVIDFMMNKISSLPENTKKIITTAACIGNQFNLSTLSSILEIKNSETSAGLWKAMEEDLIIPLSNDYKIIDDWEGAEISYRFNHDRIRQAAYSTIDDATRQEIHLKTGRILLKELGNNEIENRIFDIVTPLNSAENIITDKSERDKYSELNFTAGKKAKSATAYNSAFTFLTSAIEFLPDDSWEEQYEKTHSIFTEAAEAAYLSGNFEKATHLIDTVMKKSRSTLDQVNAYDVKIRAMVSQNQLKGAINTAIEILGKLGVSAPKKPSKLHIIQGVIKTKITLGKKKIEDLINHKELSDPEKLAAMQIIMTIGGPAYLAAPDLFVVLALKMVIISLKFGNSSISPYAYGLYGLILCGVIGDIESGYKFGRLAMNLDRKSGAKRISAKINTIFYTFIYHWKESLKSSIKPLIEGYQMGVETGDFEYACYCAHTYSFHSFYSGKELGSVNKDTMKYIRAIKNMRQERNVHATLVVRLMALSLAPDTEDISVDKIDQINEHELLKIAEEVNDESLFAGIYLYKLIVHYLFEEYEKALEASYLYEKYLNSTMGLFSGSLFTYLQSLCLLFLYPEAKQKDKKAYLKKVFKNQKKLKKWADHGPANHKNKYLLVEAELAARLGKKEAAVEHYENAIRLARENEFLHEEAMGHENAAKYWLSINNLDYAELHLRKAHHAYQYWGASLKVNDMEKKYPYLKIASTAKTKVEFARTVPTTQKSVTFESSIADTLDFSSVMKAAQSLSGEIYLSRLLEKMISIIIMNAAAQKGFLILYKNEQWYIEAESHIESRQTSVLRSIPINESSSLSAGIVQYVIRTKQKLVLNEVTKEGNFMRDPYIKENKPKSILCMPLINQSKLLGVLYLENNLTEGAFLPERIKVLEVLSSQMSISIENAFLYDNLEQKVKERTATIEEQKRMLEISNQKMLADLTIAKEMQNSLLPGEIPQYNNAEIFFQYIPSETVSGDFIDYCPVDDFCFGVCICDVSGHGLPAALLSNMFKMSLTLWPQTVSSPVESLSVIQNSLAGKLNKNFITTCIVYFDLNKKILKMASAGHDPLIILKKDGTINLYNPQGHPILDFFLPHERKEETIHLNSGDKVIIYTDGLTEERNTEGKMLEIEGLQKILSENSHLGAKDLGSFLTEFIKNYSLGTNKQEDDITFSIIEIK